MSRFDKPVSVINLLVNTPALADYVRDNRKTPDEIFEQIRKTVPEKQLLPVLRFWALYAINGAINDEKRRIRKSVKDGRDVTTPFTWLLNEEREWDIRVEEINEKSFRELVGKISGVLSAWIMDDGRPLGLVSAGYVRSVATREESLSLGHQKNAAFYRRIVQDLPDDAIIGAHVSSHEAEAARLAVFGEHAKPLEIAA